MAQTSDEIRHEIEETREHMAATAHALAYKADVPTRTREWLGEKKDALISRVSDVTPDGERIKQRMRGVTRGVARKDAGRSRAVSETSRTTARERSRV